MITPELKARLDAVVAGLNEQEKIRFKTMGWCHEPDPVRWIDRRKYVAIDFGSSGAFLVDKATGELYNIQGYGRPDLNKKKKADLGNLYTVDPAALHPKRWNSLR